MHLNYHLKRNGQNFIIKKIIEDDKYIFKIFNDANIELKIAKQKDGTKLLYGVNVNDKQISIFKEHLINEYAIKIEDYNLNIERSQEILNLVKTDFLEATSINNFK